MKNFKSICGKAVASLAKGAASKASNQVCVFIIGQPKLPKSVKSLRKF